jgi:(1->4)-alpha-D-glucan 1-alpha-D-glucosylmutase
MRVPTATYRIQFSHSFGFRKARRIVSYLAQLGISDVYASPIFKARKGSSHGYDIVDPNEINPELGSVSDFESVLEELEKRNMGWVQDIVPNHLAFHRENPMLMDVLENGIRSDYSHYFDIDWEHPSPGIKGKLLAPFLGSFYGESLEEGQIVLKYGPDGLKVAYYDLEFPLQIESYLLVFTHNLPLLQVTLGEDHPDFVKILGILYVLKNLPSIEDSQERYAQIKFIKRTLFELYRGNEDIGDFVDGNLRAFNGQDGENGRFNLLDELLAQQFFRLSFWKVAAQEIDYRRFFNISALISVRVEDEDVFNHVHQLIFELLKTEKVSGLRIDHVDGLYDPSVYLQRVRNIAPEAYIVVEKILNMSEELPHHWPVQGTTGYDFLNYVNGLFCDTDNEKTFAAIYSSVTGFSRAYEEVLFDTRRLIIHEDMAGDVDNLAHLVQQIAGRDRHGSDITLYALRRALTEVLAVFPVYRTYANPVVSSERDNQYIRQAMDRARKNNPGLTHEFMFIERFLMLDFPEYLPIEEKRRWLQFSMKFQQHTGPLMAKGFEDTMLYVYNRLLSLNEVGGRPDQFGCSLSEFHAFNRKRFDQWLASMNATSTHDTKRGEDVRTRINVLSEIPGEWKKSVRDWMRMNRGKKTRVAGRDVPDKNDEYFLYQILIGAFPNDEEAYPQFVTRIKEYIIKAVREAKVHTAWLRPDTEYEAAYESFVDKILTPSQSNRFLKAFRPFQRRISHYGIFGSLSQTMIKIASPGVPDFYQGSELWDLNLVDPDNRRPVDFGKRRSFLTDIRKRSASDVLGLIEELLANKEDGRIKIFLIHMALKARNRNPEVFRKGTYVPLEAAGRFSRNLIAFGRNYRDAWSITIAPRLLTSVIASNELPLGRHVWQDTEVIMPEGAPSRWRNIFSGEIVSGYDSLMVGEILSRFPVALLLDADVKRLGAD